MRQAARQMWSLDCVVGAFELAICRIRSSRCGPMGVRAKKRTAASAAKAETRSAAGRRLAGAARAPEAGAPLARPRNPRHGTAIAPAARPTQAPRERVAVTVTTEAVAINAQRAR